MSRHIFFCFVWLWTMCQGEPTTLIPCPRVPFSPTFCDLSPPLLFSFFNLSSFSLHSLLDSELTTRPPPHIPPCYSFCTSLPQPLCRLSHLYKHQMTVRPRSSLCHHFHGKSHHHHLASLLIKLTNVQVQKSRTRWQTRTRELDLYIYQRDFTIFRPR